MTTTLIEHWSDRAACKGQDTAKFFPQAGDVEAEAWARSWCQVCPVSRECLQDAMSSEPRTSGFQFGIYGDTTPAARNSMYRGRGRRKPIQRQGA